MREILVTGKVRSDKYLLKLLLKFIKANEVSGMCSAICSMHHRNIINYEERSSLKDYLLYNTPYDVAGTSVYWWPSNCKRPRKRWLRRQIKSLK